MELLGFSFAHSLEQSLLNLDLLTISSMLPNDMLILNVNNKNAVRKFSDHVKQQGHSLEYEECSGPNMDLEEINKLFVPNDILQKISSWISRQCS